jgi:enoyl-CoA hydratase/carnithine racemase
VAVVKLSETRDGIRQVLFNRPESLNTLNAEVIAQFGAALDEVEHDESCRVLLLTGAGRAFCAGLDLGGYGDDELVAKQGSVRRLLTRQREIAGLVQRLHRLRQPVIAAVNGPAAGGGLAFVLASDIRIAARGAIFAVSFIRAGFSACDIGTSWLLPRIVGAGRAHELMLTGRRFDAEEALRIGLLADVVAPEDLLEVAHAKAAELQQNAPLSVELTKQGMWIALETPSFDASVEFENRQQVLTAYTEDQPEAVRAFLAKEPPRYRYR